MESQEATGTPAQNAHVGSLRRKIIFGVVAALGLAAIACFTGFVSYICRRAAYTPTPATFAGSSESLQQTVIVPTLDSPCPPNKNIIWCSSFQLAWNEVRDKVIGAPLEVVGAEGIAARLNQAKQSTSDLEQSCFYAAGGRLGNGIVDRIKQDMAARFPSHSLPDLDQYGGGSGDRGILAYSYLTAHVPFLYSFQRGKNGLEFTDFQGARTEVVDFGYWPCRESSAADIRKQVGVLFYHDERTSHPPEYALDLCTYSRPYQVVVAMVKSEGSLAETLAGAQHQMEEFRTRPHLGEEALLRRTDILAVPEMSWRIDHHFGEIIGKTITNAGPAMPIVAALQTTEFRLDRSGAGVASEAVLVVKAIPREFLFNRPFLVYMQKRGAQQPFFVMWVDNAELLTRK